MKPKILIVDDQETVRNMILLMLAGKGEETDFDTFTVNDGKAACDIAPKLYPDLILMDWMMPGMSGIEATKKLKAQEATKNIPILMVTWDHSAEKLQDALEAGAADHIKKPIDQTELIARVNAALKESYYKKQILEQKEKVENYASQLEKKNEELKQFAAIVSHDLKEPLRKIIYSTDNLKKSLSKKLTESDIQNIEKIEHTANRMNSLIQDILSFSKVTTIHNQFEMVTLNYIVNEVLRDLEVRIKETHAIINLSELPSLESDKTLMRQLFQNLIGNALKFHKPGENPVINIKSKKLNDKFWEIEIQDNGIGFDEKYLDRIFNPFQRLHGSGQYEGNGMGTAICQKIVERHGGAITAKSIPNKGSSFIIRLPEKEIKKQ